MTQLKPCRGPIYSYWPPHINNTHYAMLILMMYGALDRSDKNRVVAYVHTDGSLAQANGAKVTFASPTPP